MTGINYFEIVWSGLGPEMEGSLSLYATVTLMSLHVTISPWLALKEWKASTVLPKRMPCADYVCRETAPAQPKVGGTHNGNAQASSDVLTRL